MPIFGFNDPVEKQAFDKLNRRLALASHSGELRLYTVDNCKHSSFFGFFDFTTFIFSRPTQTSLGRGDRSGDTQRTILFRWSKSEPDHPRTREL